MTATLRFRLGLMSMLCAASSSLALAAPKADPSILRDFKSWEVACDNVKRCAVEGVNGDDPDPEKDVVVWLWRDAGPDGRMQLEIAAEKPVGADQMRFDGHAFGTDPSKWKTWRPEHAQSYGSRLGTDDASVIAAWVNAARDARTISFGDPAAAGARKLPLAGLSAALLAVDDVQGRVGTVTAWRRAGAAPASSVPAALPLPVVRPAAPVPEMSKAEQQRLIDATFKKFRADVKRCYVGDDDEPLKAAPQGSAAAALSASEAVVTLGCADTSYNDTTLWYRVSRQPPFTGKRLDISQDANTDPDPDGEPPLKNALMGAGYDSSRRSLESFERVHSPGDCGAVTKWIFDGANFVLAEIRAQGTCAGFFSDDWPWVYRTKSK
ncbi:DUF1176 domain-containing protein [Trinickia terrae]|uniref:DUF1176 domain-containing protein n=1 Tax=Trinickia terrae TaxID=2571161 RepID=A0A4U1HGN4_9BURK|nr:DUF1176 domain-containing protein [Trinickia terrae]TKC80182.1 DUF1176 domain-containing protein [Trinickia terrae]